jgi:2-haloacid dehalogenase
MNAAVVFDAYGTLFNVHSIARRAEELYPGNGMALSQLWRSKQLEYTWLRSLMGRYQDFEAVTLAALRFACGSLNLALTSEHRAALMDEYLHLTPYPEVPETLSALAGRKLGILSNGSPSMLERLLRNTGLTEYFNFILSVDAIGIYKPHPSVYQFAVDNLGVKATDISFVSSNYWDAAGAAAFGFRVFWIKRTETMPDELGVQPYGVLSSLAELPALLV